MFRSGRADGFVKKIFMEISQISQENTCAGDSFLIKLQALDLRNFQEHLFLQNTSGGCFWIFNFLLEITTSAQAIKLKFGRDKFA